MIDHSLPRRQQARRSIAVCAALALTSGLSGTSYGLPLGSAPPGPPHAPIQVQDQQAPPETPFEELNQALAAARAKLDELASGAEVAALAMRLRQELETVKAQNQGLQKDLEELRDSQAAAREKVELAERRLAQRERAMAALAAEDEARSKEAERAATEAAQLRRQLAAARSELEDARTSRDDAKARLSDMQQVVDGALSEAATLGQAASELKQSLAQAAARTEAVETERDEAQRALVALRRQSERLERELADARSTLEQRAAENQALEEQVAVLRAAADSATDIARQNLLAVEDKIKLLNDALAGMRPALGPEADEPAETLANGFTGSRLDRLPSRRRPARPPWGRS